MKLNILDLKLWSFTLIPFLICGLIYKFLYSPLNQKLKALNKDLKLTNIEFASSLDKDSELRRLTTAVERLKEEMSRHEANLLGEGAVSQFLNKVTGLADDSGIQLDSLKPSPLNDAGFCNELTLEINITATYPKLMEYLFKLEQLPGLIKLAKMDIGSPGEGSGQRVNMRAGFLVSKSQSGEERAVLDEKEIAELKSPFSRNIFSPTTRTPTGEDFLGLDLKVILLGEKSLAVINGEPFGEGERVGGWTIAEIREGEVLLTNDVGQEKVLRLRR